MQKWLIPFILLFSLMSRAQSDLPEFNISDTTIAVCDGILYDTGGPEDPSGNSENIVFTISPGAPIEITFVDQFCLENGFDFLFIYDGEDTGAPVIASLTGTNIGLPGPFVATSGSVAIQFVSDANVAYCGWQLIWSTLAPPPPTPAFTAEPFALCETNVVPITFNYPLGCDWIYSDTFEFDGPQGFTVLDVVVNCTDDSTLTANVILDQTIDFNCTYTILGEIGVPDVCDSIWVYPLSHTFIYDQCPIRSDVIADPDSICAGQCTSILATVEGCFDHTFEWDNGLADGPGPHVVCPQVTTTYVVTITEVPTGNIAQDSITIEVITPIISPPPSPLCQSAAPVFLEAVPPGGSWYGPGIQDETLGILEPDSIGTTQATYYYIVSDLCVDSITISVTPIDAGNLLAACPGSAPFLLEGEPTGGVWSGSEVVPVNMFNPANEGVYEAVYALNGCTDTLIINVFDIVGTFDLGSICQSEWPDTIDFSPLGGTWYGEGILDSLLGVFDPNEMTPGNQTLTYVVEGCNQAATMEILEIQTGNINKNSCPEETPFLVYANFSPPGGYWEGLGIVDQVTGMYDPSLVPNNTTSTILYHAPNGCTDTTYMWNIQTHIPTDTVYFCITDDTFPLDYDHIGRQPGGGTWTGNGVVNPNNSYFEFLPSLSGPGEFLLTYEANTCIDTVRFIVYPDALQTTDIGSCSNAEAFYIEDGLPTGGLWYGSGVMDAETGWFDPAAATPGEYEVYWITPTSCIDSVHVLIDPWYDAQLLNIEDYYCFQDENLLVEFSPEEATFSGALSDSLLNPAVLGQGYHEVILTYSSIYCMSSDTVNFWIYPEILSSLSASINPVCQGSGTVLSVVAEGGLPDSLLTYSWSDGLFPVSTNTVVPQQTTTYYVEVNDGCSDPSLDSIIIEILPPISANIALSDTACFGAAGWVSAVAMPSGDYAYFWNNDPFIEGGQASGTAGSSMALEVEDLVNGCVFDTLVVVPSYSPIAANFSVNPNAECIAFDDNPISFIDLSQHGLGGLWDFGNGENTPYEPGENPVVAYEQPGSYEVVLTIINEGGCVDSMLLDICILPPSPLFIPDIFSPNGDGMNDVLYVRGNGIEEMQFVVYDRWGEKVFESSDPAFGWDGQFRGQPAPSGVYVYHLFVALNSGIRQTLKGDVTLLR
ncbi:MAG: gliding motility-associated C-terminal domain-containing protein [Flavobacteriales bacterium]|nr:gliding motility-associated C-terminal domain-containing protein [Flavobacteriales bacterium]